MKSEILKRIIVSQKEEILEKFNKGNIVQRAVNL
jgi:hypothetical protein